MGCFAEERNRSRLREQLSSLRTCNAKKTGSVCVREPVSEAGTVGMRQLLEICRNSKKYLPSVGLLNSVGFQLVGTERISFHKDSEGNDIYFEGGNFVKELC